MKLLHYESRQMMINEYVNEELVRRDGYFIDYLERVNNQLFIHHRGAMVETVFVPSCVILQEDTTFPNYYVLEWDRNRVELYFP